MLAVFYSVWAEQAKIVLFHILKKSQRNCFSYIWIEIRSSQMFGYLQYHHQLMVMLPNLTNFQLIVYNILLLLQILVILNLKQMIEMIEILLQNEDLNWKCALAIISVLVYTHSDGTELIYGKLKHIFQNLLQYTKEKSHYLQDYWKII